MEVLVHPEQAGRGRGTVMTAVGEHEGETGVARTHRGHGIELVLLGESVRRMPQVNDHRHACLLGDGERGREPGVVHPEVAHRAVQLQDPQSVHGESAFHDSPGVVLGRVNSAAAGDVETVPGELTGDRG